MSAGRMTRKGFSLIETIITMVLLLVVIIASLQLYPLLLKIIKNSEARLVAENIAYAQLEDLRRWAHENQSLNLPASHTILDEDIPTGFTISLSGSTSPLYYQSPNIGEYRRVTVICTTPSGLSVRLIGDVTLW